STTVWDTVNEAGSASFGYVAAKGPLDLTRRLMVTNYSAKARTYSISSNFRYASDDNGAVQITTPATVHVPAGQHRSFHATAHIDPTKLPTWNLDGGLNGGNGALLDGVEFDGYLTIADKQDTVHVPWHVLPHKAAGVTPVFERVRLVDGVGYLVLANDGAVD